MTGLLKEPACVETGKGNKIPWHYSITCLRRKKSCRRNETKQNGENMFFPAKKFSPSL
jgi:hypothetical protein